MNTQRKRMYTGKVELHNGWELRPYAYLNSDGTYVPELSARKHHPGSAIDIVTIDEKCCSKDDAFSVALKRGMCLVATLAMGTSIGTTLSA
ncbi:MAG: hypothetical protein RDU24_13030 [Humidesulfovibrio sp.]|uniref:hypothetical protein n=1 Tax=Humidesulfovibrio sp. TaxID=2910988 RepID=UPI0027EB5198|nr:hypothetical protein [Humidesulfovibrio sp.]MDQ7836299.1 hypothetical protein [Humidesulfovibrio sp.]